MTTHLIVWKKPKVDTEKKEYHLTIGSTASISCTVITIDYAIKNITWFKKINTGQEVMKGIKTSYRKHDNFYLNLTNIKPEESGEYVCTGAHDYGKENTTIFVHVGAPSSVRVQKEYVSKEGGDAVILCYVSSNGSFTSTLYQRGGINSYLPSPTFHEGKLEKTQKFRLHSLTKQNAGRYICQANNTYDTGRNETELIILYANITGQSHGLKRNMALKLVCDTNKKGGVRRKLNGKTITDQNTRTLYIQKINRIHTGNYTCGNTYGGITATSVSVYIYVKDLPMVYSNQLNNTALVGDDIVVHCGYDKESEPSYVEWSHNNVPISNFNSKRYSGGTVSVPTLTIHKAEKSDSGNYTCNVTNEIGSSYSGVISIIITVTLHFVVEINCKIPSKIWAEEHGNSLTISCDIKSKKFVYWELQRLNDTEFTPLILFSKETKMDQYFDPLTYATRRLNIRRIQKEVFGKYRCRFYSNTKRPKENRRRSNEMHVGIPMVHMTKRKLTLEKGKRLQFTCNIESYPKATSVLWTRTSSLGQKENIQNDDRITIHSTTKNSYLVISSTLVNDSGIYTCTATNGYFNSSDSAVLGNKPTFASDSEFVTVPVEEGKTVNIQVTVNTVYPPVKSVTWYRGMKNEPHQDNVIFNSNNYLLTNTTPVFQLKIINAKTIHNSYYTCVVENVIGRSKQEFSVFVWAKPAVNIIQPNITTKVGTTINLTCKVMSHLLINRITWYKVNGQYHEEVRNVSRLTRYRLNEFGDTYQKHSLTEHDSGTYICTATHRYGEGEDQVTVSVGYPPNVVIEHEEYVSAIGNKVDMECKISSKTPFNQKFSSERKTVSTWKKDQEANVKKGTIIINQTTTSHAGTYKCIGTNIYGSEEKRTELVVLSANLTGRSTGLEKDMDLLLNCTISGKGSILWEKDNRPMAHNTNHSHLHLMNITRSNSGDYTCEIVYRNVTAKSGALRIYVKDIPIVTSSDTKIESFSDKTVILHCDFDKESEAHNVKWIFNNASVSTLAASGIIRYSGGNRTVPSLTIHKPQPSDSGDYVCAVDNSVGTGYSKFVKLIIQAPERQKSSGNVGVLAGSVGSGIGLLIVAVVIFVLVKKRKDKENCSIPSQDSTVDPNNTNNLYSRVEKKKSYINIEIPSAKPSTSNHTERTIEGKVEESNDDSTYYNAFETKPTRIKVTEIKDYLNYKGGDGIREEFKKVPYGILHPTTYAEKPANKTKNRYKTTFAYDHTRVTLHNGSFKTDYINANYIDGFDKERQYIACQGPTQATLSDHWGMIWQENVHQVIMLTNLVEGMKPKCERYWPEGSEQMKVGPFRLTLVTEKERATFVTREIDVYNKETTKIRRVVQYHFTAWPDHGTPNPLDLVAFYRRVVADDVKENIPILVHCSAGIGRTGTYIGLDAMTKSGNTTGYIDIFDFLKQMRYCRMNMVQTAEQYVFLYHALIEMFRLNDTAVRRDQLEHVWRNIESEKGHINTHGLYKEFKILKACVEETVGKPAVLSPVDANKNRNRSIVPLDNSRVFLVSYERGRSDYINAVNVPSYTHQRGFLVTQLPLQDTRVDFWTMMVDHGSKTIVLILDNEKEVNIFYSSDMSRLEIGSFTIDVVNKEDCGNGIAKVTVDVTRKNYEETYTFLLYQIVSEDTLSPSQLGGMTDLVFRQETNSDRPITVVSGDGARNCGLFCVFTNAVSSLTMDDRADIFHLSRVAKLHQPAFLSEYDEYRRCYEALYVYTESTNMYANT